jgi:hypothetical protein
MLIDALVVCLALGALAGGRLSRLASVPLRHIWLFALGFAIQVLVIVPPFRPAAGWIHIASYVPLILGVAVNLHIRELWVAGLGLVLNFSVIAANGGKMPTSEAAIHSIGRPELVRYVRQGRHARNAIISDKSRLAFLGDRFALPRPYPRPTVFSPGDVFLTLGVCALILRGMGSFGLRSRGGLQKDS